jgi:hypothetical protein
MKLINNIGFILLAAYLILIGIMTILPGFALPGIIMGVLALAAGVCILLGK